MRCTGHCDECHCPCPGDDGNDSGKPCEREGCSRDAGHYGDCDTELRDLRAVAEAARELLADARDEGRADMRDSVDEYYVERLRAALAKLDGGR